MTLTIKDIDQTQADWNEGTLTNVEADAGGYLRLLYSPNVVPDGDFSGQTLQVPYSTVSNGTLSIVTGGKYGTYCLKHEATGNDSCTNNYSYSLAPAAEGETWTASIDVKGAVGGESVELFLFPLDSTGNYIQAPNTSFNASTDWQRFSITATMPAGTVGIATRVDNNVAGNIVYWDGWQVEKRSSATPFHEKDYVYDGNRLSPQIDLASVGTVESSSVSWNGGYNGIEYGYDTDDLTYYINQWGGVSNVGEIDLTGTQFTKWDGTVCDITPINSGVALQDGSTVEGYLMYSAESVFTRFSANPPNLYNCDHIIGVRYNAGQWEYDNNTAWFPFTPVSSDCLIAKVGWGVSYLSKLAGSGITIETRTSLDGGSSWSDWQQATNGGVVPGLACLSFDGVDDYVDCGNAVVFDINSAITLEAWFYTTHDGVQQLINKRPAYDLHIESSTELQIVFWIGDIIYRGKASGLSDVRNRWVHLAGTYDGSEINIYVDGVLKDTVAVSGSIDTTINRLVLGAQSLDYSATYFLEGFEDEVRIWNIVRTQQEIQDNMYKRLTGNEPGLVAYYPLDEGTGTTATDLAGGNNGTINGASWASGTDVSNGLIQCRQTLSTQDPSVTPELQSIAMSVTGASSHGDTVTYSIDNQIEENTVRGADTIGLSIIEEAIVNAALSTTDTHTFVLQDDAQKAIAGARESLPYDLSGLSDISYATIEWRSMLYDQRIQIETSYTLDGVTWSDWTKCTNRGYVPGLEDVSDTSNAAVKIKQTLASYDGSTTPILYDVMLTVASSVDRAVFEPGADSTRNNTANDVLTGGGRSVAEWGADVTGNNTAADTTNVNGRSSSTVSSEAQSGQAAKDKIDTDVGSESLESTTGAQSKANSAESNAKTYSDKYGDASNVTYGSGNSVDSKEPAEAGADVTANNPQSAAWLTDAGALATLNSIDTSYVTDAGDLATVNADALVYFSSTAPTTPANNPLWGDTSTVPYKLKRWNGETWDIIATLNTGALADVDAADWQSQVTGVTKPNDVQKQSANIATAGWYRIAINPGNRAKARFILTDTGSSRHNNCEFLLSCNYNRIDNAVFTLLDASRYSTKTFSQIRLLTNGTYDDMFVEVYIDNADNTSCSLQILDNVQTSGWNSVDFIAGSIPAGYNSTVWAIDPSKVVDVTGDNTANDVLTGAGKAVSEHGATNDAAWRSANDATKIDGGKIETGSIVALGTVTTGKLQSLDGKFVVDLDNKTIEIQV